MDQTVLIADDDPALVEHLGWRCRRLGLRVLTAHDALSTLTTVRDAHPDMVCLDVNMPGGNGLSVCEMLASEPAWTSIPVIILTGREDEQTVIRCHQLCAYYIPKCPNVWARVEPLLCELLGLPAAGDGLRDECEADGPLGAVLRQTEARLLFDLSRAVG